MDGILLVDKPAGISSFGAVYKVRKIISQGTGRKIKVGHTGTLDPAATGLLILVLGSYCKRADKFSKLDKTYEVELTLGTVSSTADSEGELVQKSVRQPSTDEVIGVLNKFVGEIEQVPPAFSAVKVGGQRAYKLARAGKDVLLTPRKVKIFGIESIDYSYPRLRFTARVSSGTYIRSLAVDIGSALGVGAYMSALNRCSVGQYRVGNALTLDNIIYNDIINNVKQIPPKS